RPLPDPPPFVPDLNINFPDINFPSSTGHSRYNEVENQRSLLLLRDNVQRANTAELSAVFKANLPLLFPYFCRFRYLWPWLYRCDEVAVVETDQNGRFDTCFWYQGDQPDVYLWIEYPLDDELITVYRPGVSCGTYWNYVCGTDIDIQLSDNRIPPICGSIHEGTSVVIRAIGHHVSPLDIQQNLAASIPLPGAPGFRTVGLTDYRTHNLGSYSLQLVNKHVRPFTGSFPVYAQFGDALPSSQVQYFQVQYRRIYNAGLQTLINPFLLNTGWKTLDSGQLSRRYVVQDGLDFKYEYYPMGPYPVNGEQAYRIPPVDPQLAGIDGQPASTDPTARWTRYDRVKVADIDTSRLDGNGVYEFRVRMLDQNGNLAGVSSDFFRVPDPSNSNQTMAAPATYLRQFGANAVFQFRLRIDNQAPDLSILGVALDGNADAMSDCGFVTYQNGGQQLGLSFKASHPQGFSLFEFDLERGRKNGTVNAFTLGDAKGVVTGSKSPYVKGAGGVYRTSFSVANLLVGCGNKAAFSEVLTVRGLHTDGTHTGDFFRQSVSNAFALAPA
ncbi:MAG: hypothetical protein HRU12_17565, partial [Phaeodactylibacter sp.]|nr:hypothetical protein [Phaeodactylibacter sp.]